MRSSDGLARRCEASPPSLFLELEASADAVTREEQRLHGERLKAMVDALSGCIGRRPRARLQ